MGGFTGRGEGGRAGRGLAGGGVGRAGGEFGRGGGETGSGLGAGSSNRRFNDCAGLGGGDLSAKSTVPGRMALVSRLIVGPFSTPLVSNVTVIVYFWTRRLWCLYGRVGQTRPVRAVPDGDDNVLRPGRRRVPRDRRRVVRHQQPAGRVVAQVLHGEAHVVIGRWRNIRPDPP